MKKMRDFCLPTKMDIIQKCYQLFKLRLISDNLVPLKLCETTNLGTQYALKTQIKQFVCSENPLFVKDFLQV